MSISAADVKALRDRTQATYKDCKAALEEVNGDLEAAVKYLRERNAAIQDKKQGRETAEGRIAVHIDEHNVGGFVSEHNVGGIIEVRCESAPVAKGDDFIALAKDLAKHVASKTPTSADEMLTQPFAGNEKQTVNDRIAETIGKIQENMKPARVAHMKGLLGSYTHHDGTVGVLLQVEGEKADPQLLRDVCMHITANDPAAARRDEVSEDDLAKEREIAKAQAAATGKPAEIVERIVDGKMKNWYAENVLEEQQFVKDPSKTVGQLLKEAGLKMGKFIRFKVGQSDD